VRGRTPVRTPHCACSARYVLRARSRNATPTRGALRAEHAGAPSGYGAARVALALATCLTISACDWFTTFIDQPRQEPWEQQWSDTVRWLGVRPESMPPRGNPQFSVPIYGTSIAAFVISAQPTPGALDSLALLSNPTPVSDSSLANGRRHYQINCAVCHGATGAGNGPVTTFGLPVPSLLTDIAKNRSDGYVYGIIRNGRGLMPTYNRIEDMDRWDVVNYLRGLQGRLGAPVSTDPAGQPGENGPAVPTYSVTAPTRPVPFVRPVVAPNATAAPGEGAPAPADTAGHSPAPRGGPR
jgi:mono/diheme cytochrome c family protein